MVEKQRKSPKTTNKSKKLKNEKKREEFVLCG